MPALKDEVGALRDEVSNVKAEVRFKADADAVPTVEQLDAVKEQLGQVSGTVKGNRREPNGGGINGGGRCIKCHVAATTCVASHRCTSTFVGLILPPPFMPPPFGYSQGKADACDAVSKKELEDFDTLAQEQVMSLRAALQLKADAATSATEQQLEELRGALHQEVSAAIARVTASVETLGEDVHRKADASAVPTTAQLEALASDAQRKTETAAAAASAQLEAVAARLREESRTEIAKVGTLVDTLSCGLHHKADCLTTNKN